MHVLVAAISGFCKDAPAWALLTQALLLKAEHEGAQHSFRSVYLLPWAGLAAFAATEAALVRCKPAQEGQWGTPMLSYFCRHSLLCFQDRNPLSHGSKRHTSKAMNIGIPRRNFVEQNFTTEIPGDEENTWKIRVSSATSGTGSKGDIKQCLKALQGRDCLCSASCIGLKKHLASQHLWMLLLSPIGQQRNNCVLLWQDDKVVLASKNQEKTQEAEPDTCQFKSLQSKCKEENWEFRFSRVARRSLAALEWEEEQTGSSSGGEESTRREVPQNQRQVTVISERNTALVKRANVGRWLDRLTWSIPGE